MRFFLVLIAIALCGLATRAFAVEGPTAAGPIGGSDIRSAFIPPPGLYFGAVGAVGRTTGFLDGTGRPTPGLQDARLAKDVAGAALFYVPDVKLLGGSIGILGLARVIDQYGHFAPGAADRRTTSVGDPYVEVDWARHFGALRASRYANAFPIREGLSVLAGFGAVIPVGYFTASDPLAQALSGGTNIVDLAPSLAVTYTTRPIFLEGTEISAKAYLNNYIRNPTTQYYTGRLFNLDFAVTEHVGPLQFGLAGTYATQLEDDKIFNRRIAPDGRRGELLQLGGVTAYDLPEYASTVKLKATNTVFAANTVSFWAVTLTVVKKVW